MLTYIIATLIALLIAFLFGSIPVALMIGKSMRGLDVREHGSGNAGTTNAIRVLGLGPGLLVFAGDVIKGALGCVVVALTAGVSYTLASAAAVEASVMSALGDVSGTMEIDPIITVMNHMASSQSLYLLEIPMALAIVATVLGHMFSPFMGFKGGKGVATALGSVAVVLPLTAVCSLTVFALVVLVSRYVSLGSVIAVITVPLFTVFFYGSPTYIAFTVLLAVAVVWAHRKNIVRLVRKEEPRFSLPERKGKTA